MQKAKDTLDAIKDSIINAYEAKTGLRRTQIGQMMTAETDLTAQKAVELGFADGILYTEDRKEGNYDIPAMMFSRMAVVNSLLDRLPRNPADPGPPTPAPPEPAPTPPNPGPPTPIPPATPQGTPVQSLYQRLNKYHNEIFGGFLSQ